MNRSTLHLIPVLAFLIIITSTVSAHAWSFIVSKFSSPYNQCLTCHVSNSNLALNPYGEDYLDPTHRSRYESRHPTGVSSDCNNCHSGKGYPIVQSGLDAMDSDLDQFTNQAEFSAGTFPGDATSFPVDSSAPTVTGFSVPATSNSLTVSITSLTATDDVSVSGYLLNTTGVAPAAGDAGWSATAPATYTFPSANVFILYAWAKDAAGNISAPASTQVDTTPSQTRVNQPPTASVGADQLVVEGESVFLNGGGSTDDLGIISYAWLQLSGPGGPAIAANHADAVMLSDSSASRISFVTPAVDAAGTTLTFRLTVTDGDGAQDSAEVQVTVEDNGITAFDGMPGVISTYSADGQPIGIGNTGANACTYIASLGSQDVSGGNRQPLDAVYGFVDFELKVTDPANTSVTFYLPSPAPAGYKWYKYTDARGWFDFSRDLISGGSGDGAVFSADRTQVTVYITDNGEFDDDPTANIIKDPGGLASGLSSSISVGSNSFGSGGGGGCFIQSASDHADSFSSAASLAAGLFLLAGAAAMLMLRGCIRK